MKDLALRVRRKFGLKPKGKALDIYRSARRAFTDYPSLLTFHKSHFAEERATEEALSRRGGQVAIYHTARNEPAPANVSTGAKFLDMFNFRESFVDPVGLNARQRHLLLAVQARTGPGRIKAAVFEHETALRREFERSGLQVTPSHYVDDHTDPFFQDLQQLTYEDQSYDLAIHSDVLEHIPDHKKALSECFRVLKPGGHLIFTTPVFPMEKNVLRAELASDGQLIRHHPDEIHGDNLTGGVLTFHNFGWELVEDLNQAGFENCTIEVCLSPELGLYSTNCPIWTQLSPLQPGNMLPLVLVAAKPLALHRAGFAGGSNS